MRIIKKDNKGNKTMLIRTIDVSKILCELSGYTLTPRKLYDLLYLCQGFYMLKNDGNPLFDGMFTAAEHGVVETNIKYHRILEDVDAHIEDWKFAYFVNHRQPSEHQKEFIKYIYKEVEQIDESVINAIIKHDGGAWANNILASGNMPIVNQEIYSHFKLSRQIFNQQSSAINA